MKQSSDFKAPWAKGFSSATRETNMVPAPLETWGDKGKAAQPISDLHHFSLTMGTPKTTRGETHVSPPPPNDTAG